MKTDICKNCKSALKRSEHDLDWNGSAWLSYECINPLNDGCYKRLDDSCEHFEEKKK